MPIQFIQPPRTAGQEFSEGMSPYLQMAFQAMMQRKLEEQQRQRSMQQAQQMGLISPTTPEQYVQSMGQGVKPTPYQLVEGTGLELSGGIPTFKKSGMTQMPVMTFDETGNLRLVPNMPSVPKGTRIITPSQMETPEQKQTREIETAQEKGKMPTADIKNLAKQAEMQLGNIETLEKEAEKLPGGYEGIKARGIAIATRGAQFGNVYMYERKIPAIAAGLYRALTGDNRLSDMDAQARALPLLWNTSIDSNLKKPMFDFLKNAFKVRQKMLEQGFYSVDPNTKQPVIDWGTLINEAKKEQQPQQQLPPGFDSDEWEIVQ